ncbi:MAG: hypothetical protein IKX21_00470, partial [Deltaproteobacteria bacterium]|nr:hypothetical protein [Deltaproteobacteria bacterium]
PYCVLNPAWTFHDGATFTMYSNMILLLLLAKEGKIDAIHGLHRYRLFCDDTGNAPENGYTAFDLPAPDRSEIIEETLEYINWHRGMTILEAHGLKLPDPDTWPRIVLHVANPKEDPVWVAQGVHDAYLKCECDEDEANEWLCKIKAVMRNVENH